MWDYFSERHQQIVATSLFVKYFYFVKCQAISTNTNVFAVFIVIGSDAFLSPKAILFDLITVDGESTFTLLTEFKPIVLNELNIIESDLEFKTNLPEFNIICSPEYSFNFVGGKK